MSRTRHSVSVAPRIMVVVLLLSAVWACTAVGSDSTDGRVITSGCEVDYPPFCVVDENGHATGFSVELMSAALKAMNREVTFQTGPWEEVKQSLLDGKIQALPLVGRTPEREALFDFTFPYLTMHGAIVVRDGTTDIQDLGDLKGRRVAVMKGDNTEEFLRREDRGIDIRTTPTFVEALQQLADGACDAVVMQRLVALRLLQQTGLTTLRILDRPVEGFGQDFCFAVREGDKDTLALLNEGLALVIADGTYRQLHAKWFAALELPSHRRIVVGGDHDYPPYEYLDKNGRPAGYNVELTRAIAQELGLDIEIRLDHWTRIRKGLENGEIDIVQGMFYSPERARVFDFSPPHAVNHCISVVRKDSGPAPTTLEELRGKRIIVQRGDIMHDFVVANGLTDRVSAVDSQGTALKELAEGRHDCALVARMTALYWIEKKGWTNLVLGTQSFLSPEYCYAVPKYHKALLAQFTEGLKVLDENGEYRRIRKKWLGVYGQPSLRLLTILRYVAMVAVPLGLALLVFLVWSWLLRKQVMHQTAKLRREMSERGRAEEALRESEGRVRLKLDAILSPEGNLEVLELADVVDVQAIQAMMNDFFGITGVGMAVVDLHGKVLVATGWQDICTKFHRVHPDACRHCRESDTVLSGGVEPGTFKLYRCKNNMWDMATPIVLGGRHAGNLFLGRFFFEGEVPDRDVFTEQARRYGFDEKEYLAALDRVPRWSREKVDQVMTFYVKFAKLVSELSYGNLRLARTLAERDDLLRQLRAGEAKYRSLAENTPDIIWQLGLDQRFSYINSAVESVLGYAVGEFIGQPLAVFCTADRLRQMQEIIAQVLQSTEEHPGAVFETEMIHKDGHAVALEIHGMLQKDEHGHPTGFQGVTRDITDRKQAEEALRMAELRYRTLFEQSPDGVVILDPATTGFLEFNDQVCRQLGYSREEFARLTLADVEALETPEESRRRVQTTLGEGRSDFETRQRTKQGEIRDVMVTAQALQVVGKTVYHCIWRDVTESKKAADAVRRQADFLQRMIDAMPYPVFYKDREGRYLGCNRAFEDFFGVPREHLGGKTVYELAPKELADQYRLADEELFARPGTQIYESVIQSAAGVRRDVVFHRATFDDDRGQVSGIIGAVVDITERKWAERNVRALNEELELRVRDRTAELEAANKELEAFSYSVSHDLRGPLRTIAGYSQTVIEDYGEKLGVAGKQDLERVYAAAQKMSELIDDLLVLSRLSRREMKKEKVDLSRVAREIVEELWSHDAERSVEVKIQDGLEAECDDQLMRVVLQNLLSNAWKFTAKKDNALIEFGFAEKDDLKTFYVRDNGAGFDMKYVDKLFGPFQRLHTEDEFPGTGIGLATVQRIIHRHGGWVWAEGKVGEGAAFYFTL
ncbi:MAG TPA: transporter substrate-binding domain-containing protein [Kiritimatiellia bacterium]|nr:transporter substrate-binding domain-containing protein [Kiritimatiellia bacterium]